MILEIGQEEPPLRNYVWFPHNRAAIHLIPNSMYNLRRLDLLTDH